MLEQIAQVPEHFEDRFELELEVEVRWLWFVLGVDLVFGGLYVLVIELGPTWSDAGPVARLAHLAVGGGAVAVGMACACSTVLAWFLASGEDG